jgi:hypothetical protein
MTPEERAEKVVADLKREPVMHDVLITRLVREAIEDAEAEQKERDAQIAEGHWERVGRDCGTHDRTTCSREVAAAIRGQA